jgi:outer membrane protein
MKKISVMVIVMFVMGMMVCLANAASLGYIDGQKVFSSYEKSKKAQEQFNKQERIFQDEIAKKQKQIEKEKNNNMSDGDLRKLAEKFDKELEAKRTDLMEAQKKMTSEIWDDIVKATEVTAKKMGIETVLNRQAIITGGTDVTDKVIEQLNKN